MTNQELRKVYQLILGNKIHEAKEYVKPHNTTLNECIDILYNKYTNGGFPITSENFRAFKLYQNLNAILLNFKRTNK